MGIRIGADAESTDVSALKALGATFVCRYLSDYPAKNLTASEAASLQAAGIDVVSNSENDTTDYQGGFSQGVAYATRAAQQHLAAGGPPTAPIYFSVDTNASGAAADDYFSGINSVIGVARTGVYGDTSVIQSLVANNRVKYTWRTMSTGWSGGSGGDSEFNLEQTGAFNDSYDRDASFTDDFGQWSAHTTPAAVAPPVQTSVPPSVALANLSQGDDEDMSASTTEGYAQLGWSAGQKADGVVQVNYDGEAPTLRVVLQFSTGPYVLETAWVPKNGSDVVRLPVGLNRSAWRGVIVEATSNTAKFNIYAA